MEMKEVTSQGSRLEQLKTLAAILAENIDNCQQVRVLPQLAKQYRETVREIEEMEGTQNHGDEISQILEGRKADGKPGTVRKDRTKV